MSSPRKRRRPCHFHNNGGCKKGSDNCKYEHAITLPYKSFHHNLHMQRSYSHPLSSQNDRSHEASRPDNTHKERNTKRVGLSGGKRRHSGSSKSHSSPDRRDQDLRQQTENSDKDVDLTTNGFQSKNDKISEKFKNRPKKEL